MPPFQPDPPRSLANVLLDLKEARRDLTDAEQYLGKAAEDRAIEAEQRLDNLRDEFSAKFAAATGLTFRQVQDAVSEAVL